MQIIYCVFVLAVGFFQVITANYIQKDNIPFNLNGQNFTYPFPVQIYHFNTQRNQPLQMAFMDLWPPTSASNVSNGRVTLLLHGKQFCSVTWTATAIELANAGYRVIAVDQVGFCKSSKPDRYQYTFQQLAENTLGLLNTLGVQNITLIGHSMGGMLASRFSLMYPDTVNELVLVNPIGLEDWKAKGVPYINTDVTWATEQASNYTSIRAYEQGTYYVNLWQPSYDIWVNMLLSFYNGSMRDLFTWNQALIIDMVFTQPIVYELPLLKVKTLLMIGQKDNTAIGKSWSPPAVQALLGNYSRLGVLANEAISGSTLVKFEDQGHAPQISDPVNFHKALFAWLEKIRKV